MQLQQQATVEMATVEMVYDNMVYKTPGKTKKYIVMSVDFAQATTQTQGASQDFYSGVYPM